VITDPIENPDSRRPRPFPLVRVLRGAGSGYVSFEFGGARRGCTAEGRRAAGASFGVGLRVSLSLPCNDAGSVVE
jgi:hypothetical protein